jgi:hypothetical protein
MGIMDLSMGRSRIIHRPNTKERGGSHLPTSIPPHIKDRVIVAASSEAIALILSLKCSESKDLTLLYSSQFPQLTLRFRLGPTATGPTPLFEGGSPLLDPNLLQVDNRKAYSVEEPLTTEQRREYWKLKEKNRLQQEELDRLKRQKEGWERRTHQLEAYIEDEGLDVPEW